MSYSRNTLIVSALGIGVIITGYGLHQPHRQSQGG